MRKKKSTKIIKKPYMMEWTNAIKYIDITFLEKVMQNACNEAIPNYNKAFRKKHCEIPLE